MTGQAAVRLAVTGQDAIRLAVTGQDAVRLAVTGQDTVRLAVTGQDTGAVGQAVCDVAIFSLILLLLCLRHARSSLLSTLNLLLFTI